MALVLRFLGGVGSTQSTVPAHQPTRPARDKQETDENNSAGSQAVSRVEEKTELPSRSLLAPAAHKPSCSLSLLTLPSQTSACLQSTSAQQADLTLSYLCSNIFGGSPVPSG